MQLFMRGCAQFERKDFCSLSGWLDLEIVDRISRFSIFYSFECEKDVSRFEETLLVIWNEERHN